MFDSSEISLEFDIEQFKSCHVDLEIIVLMNSGKFNMVSAQDINVDHGIE